MTYESARQFFDDLRARPDSSRAAGLTASYRFDVENAGSWRVDVEDGHVSVSESQEPADCVIATDEQTLLAVVGNEQNPMGAFMTGKIRVEGDMGLALRLRDLLS
ncbi:MAG TPA: SCP2 sterol-binding domain-containing protein [Gaiellaceae bacterium]|jgi:putative sterol carrier protein|nr:SCP2 sterol-binding domain-containing protein [Gaiellaceae bacterium]